eukprot:m.4798 g.4798  ORF g.4798 m.4798 type:complete len:360 (-) comp3705_c0_seq1:89-1168(-)
MNGVMNDAETLKLAVQDACGKSLALCDCVLSVLTATHTPSTEVLLMSESDFITKFVSMSVPTRVSLNLIQSCVRQRRLHIVFPEPSGGNQCSIFFTAPHTLELCRDSQPYHLRESYTGTLAAKFARAQSLNGGYLTWTQLERDRVKAVVAATGTPDRSNRDPNYLKGDEVLDSPWFKQLCIARRLCVDNNNLVQITPSLPNSTPTVRTQRLQPAALHVDVHGMSDEYDADCIVGTGAMLKNCGDEVTRKFRESLDKRLSPLFAKMNMQLSFGPHLQGYWGSGRNTLTQISTDPAFWNTPQQPFTHAVQVELTLRLRKHFNADKAARDIFANALFVAFRDVTCVPVPVSIPSVDAIKSTL